MVSNIQPGRVQSTIQFFFVGLKLMNKMNPYITRFYVILTLFCLSYPALNFLNQRDLMVAYSLAAQTHFQMAF